MIKVITGSGQLQGLSLPLQTPKVMEKFFFFSRLGKKSENFIFYLATRFAKEFPCWHK